MKKFLNISLLALVALTSFSLTSCLHEMDEVFDEDAVIRMDKAMAEYEDILTSNGGISKERPIRWVEIVSNRLENVARPFALHNLSDEIVRDNEIISPKPKNAD